MCIRDSHLRGAHPDGPRSDTATPWAPFSEAWWASETSTYGRRRSLRGRAERACTGEGFGAWFGHFPHES
eukprot:6661695-Alexandrium_andersonii.AAC.1